MHLVYSVFSIFYRERFGNCECMLIVRKVCPENIKRSGTESSAPHWCLAAKNLTERPWTPRKCGRAFIVLHSGEPEATAHHALHFSVHSIHNFFCFEPVCLRRFSHVYQLSTHKSVRVACTYSLWCTTVEHFRPIAMHI